MIEDYPDEKVLNKVAGNGLLDRRLFLKTLALGSAGVAADFSLAEPAMLSVGGRSRPDWMLRPGATTEAYGRPSHFELERSKRWTVPKAGWGGAGLSIAAFTPLHQMHGTITPGGLHFEVNHYGIPDIDPDRHELVIHGMVKNPIRLSVAALANYPTESHQYFLECSGNSGRLRSKEPIAAKLDITHGLLSGSEWTGVPLNILLDEAGLQPGANWIIAEGGDSGSVSRSIPLSKAMDDSMIALFQNGERLRPGQGYPMRLFNPGFEGNTSIKWIRSIRVSDGPEMSRYETSTYTDLMTDGNALQFTLGMDVKSVITLPSNANTLPAKGVYEITGLAWSGQGRIKRVEVSADGGITWADAALQGPVQTKMLTRFRIPWEWQGAPSVLHSRATDETGRVQPTRASLIAAHGLKTMYHFNAIHSWGISSKGDIKHVYA